MSRDSNMVFLALRRSRARNGFGLVQSLCVLAASVAFLAWLLWEMVK